MATSLVAELAEKLSSATNNLDFDEQTLFLNTSADTVGIGTNSPDGKLDVRQSGTDDILNLYDGASNIFTVQDGGALTHKGTLTVGVDDTGHDVKFFGATAGSYMLWDESTDDLIFGGAAQIGIGTTAPRTLLDIETSSAASYPLLVAGDIDSDGGYTGISFGLNGNANYQKARIHVEGTSSYVRPDMHFLLDATDDSSNAAIADAKVSFMNDGKVGIGISTPSSQFTVKSTSSANITQTNFYSTGGSLDATNTSDFYFLRYWDESTDYRGARLRVKNSGYSDKGGSIQVQTSKDGTANQWNDGLIIDKAGNVGIGTTAPTGVLQVNSAGAGDTAHIRLHNTNNTNNDTTSILFGFSGNDNANKGGIFFKRLASYGRGDIIFATKNTADNQNVDNSDVKMKIDSVGKVSIGLASGSAATTMLDIESGSNAGVRSKSTSETEKNYIGLSAEGGETFWVKENGDIYYSGTQSSDAKMKENIIDCPYGLDEVKKLSPKQFNFIGQETKRQGFIAQETESVVPNMTQGDSSESAEANMGFDMQGVSAVLVKAVQELDSRLRELESA